MMNNQICQFTAIQIIHDGNVDANFAQISIQLAQLSKVKQSCQHVVLLLENTFCFVARKAYLIIAEVLGDGLIQSGQKEKLIQLVYSPQGKLIEHYK